MDNVGYLTLSTAAMKSRSADISANNIANANTEGFRASRNLFETYMANTGTHDDLAPMAYAMDRGTYNDLREGSMIQTGNPLDIAIQGNAFFGFERADGVLAVGRAGSLSFNAEGNLVTSDGHMILSAGGGPVNIPQGSGAVTIGPDGTITGSEVGVIDAIGVFDEPDVRVWRKLDGGMMTPKDGAPGFLPAAGAIVRQGFVEGSNVEPITEMTAMISHQRAYERAMTVADSANDLRSQTLQRLGKPV